MAEVVYVPGAEPPVNDGERRAIKAFEERLPDNYTLYPGVQVVRQGDTDDVDLLVLTDHGLVVVEVKDIAGDLVIDNGACYVNGNLRPQPFTVTSSKAKRLKSRLMEGDPRLSSVWVAPLVVLAREPASLRITPDALRAGIVSIDEAVDLLQDPRRYIPRARPSELGELADHIRRQLNLTRGRERGVRFGPYLCTELLYRSDDEDVWAAEHGLTGEPVEIRHIGRNPANRSRRVAEAEAELVALAEIGHHPSIEGPREVLPQDDGSIALVHEPRRGPSLAELLDSGEEVPADRIILDVASALTYAHEHGVVHRRLAPRWIEVRPESAVVRGFSLFSRERSDPGAATVLIEEDANFLAPEVAQRKRAGKPSDMYSLGKLIGLLKADDDLMQNLAARLTVGDPDKRSVPSGYVLEALAAAFGVEGTPEIPEPELDEDGRFAVGTKVGPYVVSEHLGSGGFSDVYRVDHVLGGRTRALKLFRRDDAQHLVANEYRALQDLDDPHVVRVVDADQDVAGWYLVSEYLDGETLAEKIDAFEGRSNVAQVVLIGYELLDALASIHAEGVTHRDVKPENVILVEDRGAVLFDFGIASTETGHVDGVSFPYRPPGVAVDSTDPDLDLFAVGIVLCELLMGQHPYPERNPHGGAPPDVSGLPPGLAEIVGKAVDPDPSVRYRSAVEFRDALEPLVDTTQSVEVSRRDLYRRVERLISQGHLDEAEALCLPQWKRLQARIGRLRSAEEPGEAEDIGGLAVRFAGEGKEPVYRLDNDGLQEAKTWTYQVTGRPGLMIDVRIAEHPDGAAQVATVEAYDSTEYFRELVNRIRHGIYPHGDDQVMRVRYTYRPEGGRVAQRRAESVGELNDLAGVDLKAELRAAGTKTIGTRADLGLVEPRKERRQIAVVAPTSARNNVMLRAYLLTTVVPLARELELIDQSAS